MCADESLYEFFYFTFFSAHRQDRSLIAQKTIHLERLLLNLVKKDFIVISTQKKRSLEDFEDLFSSFLKEGEKRVFGGIMGRMAAIFYVMSLTIFVCHLSFKSFCNLNFCICFFRLFMTKSLLL